ncbi:hypothetical protein Acor_79980 [Acrocarpospora corrugata]|uniref:DUF2157 domain-containing protein n=1 Tax=Acrocarpospora corrugata TaxID=35763 RepID=A0A5M3WC59_9ACTN|nr:hypothetical protein [Acrocarpospora corrugata]GES05929.1 hypothetical protein Acor_79980 [Acrocarpospora corrugata]
MNTVGPFPCPDCGQQLTGSYASCPNCGLPLVGATATELWRLDVALADLRAREGHLLARREVLLRTLRLERERVPVAAGQASWSPSPEAPVGGRPLVAPPRPADMSGKAVQNLLLGLGGLLLVVAAVVFTVVSWGYLGIGGRAAVLLGFTALTLATPLVLLRRGLSTTAETVSLLGFALMLLDGYAAWQVGVAGLDRVDPLTYTGILIAVVCVLFALYGLAVHAVAGEQIRALKLAVPVAIGFGQLALPILTLDREPIWIITALVGTAGLDLLLWNLLKRGTAAVFFWITWTLGAVAGVLMTIQGDDLQGAIALSGVLVGAAVIALLQALRGKWTTPLAGGAAVALAAALAYPIRVSIDSGWWPVPTPLAAFLVAGIAVFGIRGVRRELGKAMGVAAGAFGLLVASPVLVPVMVALVGPFERDHAVWGGPSGLGARDELGLNQVVLTPPVLVVLAAVAIAVALGALVVREKSVPIVCSAAVIAVLLAVLPVAFNLPFWVLIAVQLVVTAGLAAGALFGREVAFAGLALAMVAEVAAWALVSRTATLVAAAVLAVLAAGVAWRASLPAVRAGAAGVATALVGGEAVAVWLAAGQSPDYVTFVLIAVAALAAVAAWLLPRDGIGVELAGYGLALVGLAWVVDRRMLSVALALAGLIAIGTALRSDRRKAGYVGTVLLLLASWTRLYAEDISVVEAYTVPVSVVLLAFGWWRAKDQSSWLAYGSGLSFSLLPSLLAIYPEPQHWARPLALGVVSLLVLLAGARWRLQAPALLGGFTLAIVAIHELAPWVSDLVLNVPRWVPVAVGGLLLLLVGATYEARMRDVRRFGAMIKGLR